VGGQASLGRNAIERHVEHLGEQGPVIGIDRSGGLFRLRYELSHDLSQSGLAHRISITGFDA
jgi:hypothetical protein